MEIGRVDIIIEVSMMASHIKIPREGNLEAVLHVFAFIPQKYNIRMVFDPTYPAFNTSNFKVCMWKEFYGKLKGAIPPNYPEERVKEVDLRGYVDNDHTGENKNEFLFPVFHLLEYRAD